MTQKIVAMFPDQRRAQEARNVLTAVSESVRRYISVKTAVSALTAVSCYAVLRLLGVDFAATWALLIFFLNFIPNIGSIIGVAFPALVALVQFDTLGPFVILVVTLTAINMAIGSVLEPMLMGHTLNLSPFAILLSLAFWGTIRPLPLQACRGKEGKALSSVFQCPVTCLLPIALIVIARSPIFKRYLDYGR